MGTCRGREAFIRTPDTRLPRDIHVSKSGAESIIAQGSQQTNSNETDSPDIWTCGHMSPVCRPRDRSPTCMADGYVNRKRYPPPASSDRLRRKPYQLRVVLMSPVTIQTRSTGSSRCPSTALELRRCVLASRGDRDPPRDDDDEPAGRTPSSPPPSPSLDSSVDWMPVRRPLQSPTCPYTCSYNRNDLRVIVSLRRT